MPHSLSYIVANPGIMRRNMLGRRRGRSRHAKIPFILFILAYSKNIGAEMETRGSILAESPIVLEQELDVHSISPCKCRKNQATNLLVVTRSVSNQAGISFI
jgi:hypothetical protein